MNNNVPQQFKNVIEKIIDTRLESMGMPKYISAVVESVNEDMSVDVIIPPDTDKIITNLLNKTGEILSVGDSVELCTKNGRTKNAWVAIKHGVSIFKEEMPIGGIMLYGSATNIPEKWMLCNGSSLSRTEYAELFNIIGTTYGAGDGNTTFNLPNVSGRLPLGNSSKYNMGSIGGEETHTLITTEMPSHIHSCSVEGVHRHDSGIASALWDWRPNISGFQVGDNIGGYPFTYQAEAGAHQHTIGITGGSEAHNNMPPYITFAYIIKVK